MHVSNQNLKFLYNSQFLFCALTLGNDFIDSLFDSPNTKDLPGLRSIIGSASDSRARGPGFDIRSDHISSFRLPLIQEGHLSVTGKGMRTKYWLIA